MRAQNRIMCPQQRKQNRLCVVFALLAWGVLGLCMWGFGFLLTRKREEKNRDGTIKSYVRTSSGGELSIDTEPGADTTNPRTLGKEDLNILGLRRCRVVMHINFGPHNTLSLARYTLPNTSMVYALVTRTQGSVQHLAICGVPPTQNAYVNMILEWLEALDLPPATSPEVERLILLFKNVRSSMSIFEVLEYAVSRLSRVDQGHSDTPGKYTRWIKMFTQMGRQLRGAISPIDPGILGSVSPSLLDHALKRIAAQSRLKSVRFAWICLDKKEAAAQASLSPQSSPEPLVWPSDTTISFMCVSKTFLETVLGISLGDKRFREGWVVRPKSDNDVLIKVAYQNGATKVFFKAAIYSAHAYSDVIEEVLFKTDILVVETGHFPTLLSKLRLENKTFDLLRIIVHSSSIFKSGGLSKRVKGFLAQNQFEVVSFVFDKSVPMTGLLGKQAIEWIKGVRKGIVWLEWKGGACLRSDLVNELQAWMEGKGHQSSNISEERLHIKLATDSGDK
ncbi:hypothetical protein NEDG_02040 [Nematocida displodere]|uniref:Uncharacterized protein n=1 Tax=Nematocida displodere TaxID=1805483 RepID=A0A177EMS1_9MICR|nr:hypothetical protein NEDG_02040 [Nematocida displodere]